MSGPTNATNGGPAAPAGDGPGPRRPLAARLALTLGLATAGGAVFSTLGVPLPWMLGALVVTTGSSLAGASLVLPSALRTLMVTILGVLLGSAFTPEVFAAAARWPVTIIGLWIYLAGVTGLLYLYFRLGPGYDRPTSYFAATPGGMSEMVLVGEDAGGDVRTIALIHACRILVVVLAIPVWFRFSEGVTSAGTAAGGSLLDIAPGDLGILVLCAVVGYYAARWLRIPAYRLVGPMLVSAGVHVAGLTASVPPDVLVAAAQVVIGASIGARFADLPFAWVRRTMLVALGATAVTLAAAVAAAAVLARATGFAFPPLLLAVAPGGLAEMTLIALALGVEVAFVATHHLARIAFIVFAGPFLFRGGNGKERGAPG